ncbi:actin cytoskeleton-regulatory complex protein pan1-like isoform X2 [Dendronephthya gigantea]|uniref:actin cytoskeleton-regulatory complex protein pan1-like isoform X2 n=1 Tax=Dendronephthya gigantea TaxID=151771 RepID=UPI00106BBBFD|nr:actin cytoskeleton-regulatory complex protein pan1-like isoform X2 [Dendronephthya gigantea]
MEERDRIRYETLFYCQKLDDGYLSGDNARALFIRSKLPLLDLTRIWKLSDITRDNKLDVFEFSLAMHFIEMKLSGKEIPKQNSIVNDENKEEVLIPETTQEDRQRIKDIFDNADTISQGALTMNIVKPMFLKSGLPSSTLSRIWNIADLDRDGKLCLFEFTIAVHLLKNCVEGLSLNGHVNPFSCFSNEDDTVREYKEKLSIFDKELLLEQKNSEDNLFLNSNNSANNTNLELLTGYLFDGKHVPPQLSREQNDCSFVDENRNEPHKKEEKIFDDSPNYHSYVGEKPPVNRSTETVESCKMDKSNFHVDLDNIFETVSREHMDESEEKPKFIAQPPTGYAEAEDDEEETPDILPYFQRRTYCGKDLIFEDPIGSELIGDVEFEVDFEYIINDIRKEIADEERGLPIARVLPIYKTPPIYDEFERTVVDKDKREIDLNFNDVKIEDFNEQEKHKEILINTVTKDPGGRGRGVVLNDESRSDKDNIFEDTRAKNLMNFNNIGGGGDGAEDDIVEQKRLLLQNQHEERKKLRENRPQDDERNENSRSSTPVARNAEQNSVSSSAFVKKVEKRETKPQKDVIDANYSTEPLRKDDSSVNERDRKVSDSKQDRNKVESNETCKDKVTDIMHSNGTESRNDINNKEEIDKEEGERRREAEDKEQRLLERIKYLEKKRQQLYEKKQRELNTNHFTSNEEHQVYGNVENKQSNEVNTNEHRLINKHAASSASHDPWSKQAKKQEKENEEEKRRLAEALAAKRKTEAELERQREEILQAAKERRLEEEAKQREEQEAAKQRKQTFLENLKRLKERVTTEEEDKAKAFKSLSKREASGSVQTTAGRFNSSLASSNKSQSLPGYNKLEETHSSNTSQKSALLQTNRSGYKGVVEANKQTLNQDDYAAIKHGRQNSETNKEDERKADELRRENFKSNRELFMRKVQTEQQVQKRESVNRNARPKSHYGGMFNKPVHQIIDDSLLSQNVDSSSVGDLVDEESVKQFQREQEVKKEHENMNKLRSSLERESSYTVENVEQLFSETETDNESRSGNDWDNLEKKKVKTSSHPHRRSLVNTLKTEWDSFIDVLEEDKRRESETVRLRQEISAQEEESTTLKVNSRAENSITSHSRELDDKRFDQKTIIKDNAPKRKSDLAHAWKHVSNQQNTG